jgi:hypothetical protein
MAFTRPAATVAASNDEHNSQLVTPNRVLLFAFCCAALTANLSSRQPAKLVCRNLHEPLPTRIHSLML